jgi:CheY-like chemotaxis protein
VAENLKILLVEDEVITAIMMEVGLRKIGFPIASRAVSGETAVSLATEEIFHVVLMDIRLAGQIDGIEAARQIQQIRKTTIIFMTGYQDEETRLRAQELSPLAYLVKPIDTAQLAALLGEVKSQVVARITAIE